MRLIEYIARALELIDEPVNYESGKPLWDCPGCASPKFHLMPSKPEFPDRFKCHVCGISPDAAGLVKLWDAYSRYPAQLQVVADMKRQFEKKYGPEPEVTGFNSLLPRHLHNATFEEKMDWWKEDACEARHEYDMWLSAIALGHR